MNRDDRSLDVPTIDTFLTSHRSVQRLRCPSDNTGAYERTGTSYGWFAVWDRRPHQDTGNTPQLGTPILADKAPYHTDQHHPYNALLPNTPANPQAGSQADHSPAADSNSDDPPFVAMPYAMPY